MNLRCNSRVLCMQQLVPLPPAALFKIVNKYQSFSREHYPYIFPVCSIYGPSSMNHGTHTLTTQQCRLSSQDFLGGSGGGDTGCREAQYGGVGR